MVTVAFKSAEAVTSAIMLLAVADRPRCVARQVERGFEVDAPDELEAILKADHSTAPLPVPPSVSSAQAKIALKRAGFLDAAKATLSALNDEETEIWFSDARSWERANHHVVAIGAAIGLSPIEIDDLFRQAAQIEA